jgi:hypothetical protein
MGAMLFDKAIQKCLREEFRGNKKGVYPKMLKCKRLGSEDEAREGLIKKFCQ